MKITKLFLALLTTLIIFSCSKNKEDKKQGFFVNFEGIDYTIGSDTNAYYLIDGSRQGLIIDIKDTSRLKRMYLAVVRDTVMTAGTFSNQPPSPEPLIRAEVNIANDPAQYYVGGTRPEQPLSMTLHSFTPDYVEGSFEGMVGRNNTWKPIRGSFNLPLVKIP